MDETEWDLPLEYTIRAGNGMSPTLSKKALISFILSLLGVLISSIVCTMFHGETKDICLAVALIVLFSGVLSITFGYLGLKEIRERPDNFKGKGIAIAGIVIGIILLLFFCLSSLILADILDDLAHDDDLIMLLLLRC